MISELQTDTYGSYPTLQVGFGIHRCLHKCCTFLIFKIDISALHIAELCFVIRLSKVPKEPSHGAVADKPFPLLHVMPREHMSLPTSKTCFAREDWDAKAGLSGSSSYLVFDLTSSSPPRACWSRACLSSGPPAPSKSRALVGLWHT